MDNYIGDCSSCKNTGCACSTCYVNTKCKSLKVEKNRFCFYSKIEVFSFVTTCNSKIDWITNITKDYGG